MKLLFCPKCQDVVRLFQKRKVCECGASWGEYIDNLYATYGGEAIPLAIGWTSFLNALAVRDDKDHRFLGPTFEGWVVPESSDRFVKENDNE